jgi:hypothetical protein
MFGKANLSFGQKVSDSLPKFTPNPNQPYRAAALHYAENNALHPIVIAARTHYHQTPEGVQGLGGFICHSTEEKQALCCKNTALFSEPLCKIAIPVILYPCDFQGNPIPGAAPDIQVMIVYEKGWQDLCQMDKNWPLAANDFTITATKKGRGLQLAFMPAGPALWQQDQTMYAQLLQKAQNIQQGPGSMSIEKMLGRRVQEVDIENAVRMATGQPLQVPPPPPMPGGAMMPIPGQVAPPPIPPVAAAPVQVPPIPQAPAASTPQMPPLPAVNAVPAPSVPPAPEPAVATGPASPEQISALASFLNK